MLQEEEVLILATVPCVLEKKIKINFQGLVQASYGSQMEFLLNLPFKSRGIEMVALKTGG